MRKQKLYTLEAVNNYMSMLGEMALDVIEGCLLDTYVIYHDGGVVEVFEETALNEWNSAYVRHIYRKGLPKRFVDALAEM